MTQKSVIGFVQTEPREVSVLEHPIEIAYRAEGQDEVAQRSVESVATDLLTPSLKDHIYFFTYFPYKGFEGISKLSDKLRRRFKKIFLVRELTKEKNIHYHGIGFSESEVSNFELKGYCKNPWHTHVVDSVLNTPPINNIYQPDDDNKELSSIELDQFFKSDQKTYFVNKYLTKQGQINKMIHYMCKENPLVKYQDYFLN